MTHHAVEKLLSGMDKFCKRIESKKRLYATLLSLAETDRATKKVLQITDPVLFKEVISNFGPVLDKGKEKVDLQTVFDVTLHKETGALVISNKGATLFSLSPKTKSPYLVRHIGFCVYFPGLGIELVNVGLVGNVYDGKVVLRSESACTPSFLFGSQRCNCHHQWESIRELAAHFNPIIPPQVRSGEAFEQWVQKQLVHKGGKHLFRSVGSPGFILMHLDMQNGMGSGYSEDEFSFDLYSRASMRHRGEYTSEQVHQTSMLGGFEAIGLRPDPRSELGNVGYKLAFVILDIIGVSKDIIVLTNNPLKLLHLKNNGYRLTRVKSVGEVNLAGAKEAQERGSDFGHRDINGECISFEEEMSRLKEEICSLVGGRQ
jgi:GTP cyclohydrolase II